MIYRKSRKNIPILSPFPPDDLRVYTSAAVIVSFREDWIKIVSSLLPVSFMIRSESIYMILTKSRLTEKPVKEPPSAPISLYSSDNSVWYRFLDIDHGVMKKVLVGAFEKSEC
jgi:hypothetical protein